MSGPAPRELGFSMPAEWQPHAGCWMAWPCRPGIWGLGMAAARAAFAAVARAIARFEPLTVIARPGDAAAAGRACGPRIRVLPLALDDSWMRDSGPTFVRDRAGEVAGVDWRFNAWGGKVEGWSNDDALPRALLGHLGLRRIEAPLVLEGGSIHVDGEGTLLTTEQCLLNRNRNPRLARADIEAQLAAHLGITRFIWLGEGLEDDETDGHVDNLACFARPGLVLALTAADPRDPNHRVLEDNLRRLRAARDAAGRPLEVITIEQPVPRRLGGTRLAQSYINFYLANGAVIMPSFCDPPRDEAARATLAEVFAEREVVQLPALDIVAGGGGIHCITQQQPAPGAARGAC